MQAHRSFKLSGRPAAQLVAAILALRSLIALIPRKQEADAKTE